MSTLFSQRLALEASLVSRLLARGCILSVALIAAATPIASDLSAKPVRGYLSNGSEMEDEGPWNQFLGNDRNGISKEVGLIDDFKKKKPVEVWRQPLVGGLSGISFAHQRLFTMAQHEQKQWVISMEASTGKTVWKTPIGDAYQNPMGNGPRATPTVSDGIVYVYSGEGILVALDEIKGTVLWSKNLPKELSGKPSEYGMSCSPLVVEGRIVVHVGAPGAAIVGMDRKTGDISWKAGEGPAGYSSPVAMNLQGSTQVVSLIGNQVLGLDPKSGKVLWSFPFETEFACNTACPVQLGNNVLVSAGENHGSLLLAIEKNNNGWRCTETWSSYGNSSSLRSEWQTPVYLDGYLYGMDNVGNAGPVSHLVCVDAKTGKSVWKKQRFGKGNLIAADGKLILSNIDGELILVKASKEGYEELGRTGVVGFTRQAPVLIAGKLFMRDESEIVCLAIEK